MHFKVESMMEMKKRTENDHFCLFIEIWSDEGNEMAKKLLHKF